MSWIETNLGECCELYQPQTITTKDLIEDGKYLVYGANGVIGRYDKYNHEEPQLLVTCRGATCGAVNISSPYSWINGNAMVVKPKHKSIDVRFIEYFFRGAVDLRRAITGAAQPQITRQSLSPIKFQYPSLPTQQKIVAKLDAIFAEIDIAIAAAKANAKNAEALFQSYLTEFFELEAKNNTSLLGEVCNVIGGGTPSKANEEFYTGTIPWATVRDMNKDNLDITDYKITEEAVRLSATNIIPANNVVIATRVGLGKVCILNQDTAINQDLRGVIPKSNDILDVNYLFLWFKFIAEKIIQAGRGATVQGVTLPFIKSLAIPVPTLIKQQNAVVKIQSIFNNTELAKNSYITKINELAVLKQSILQRAFSGELVKD